MINPFETPETVSIETDIIVKEVIREQFRINGSLDFYSVIKYLEEECIAKNDIIKSKIVAYYCANMVISSKLSNYEKSEILSGLTKEILALVEKQIR